MIPISNNNEAIESLIMVLKVQKKPKWTLQLALVVFFLVNSVKGSAQNIDFENLSMIFGKKHLPTLLEYLRLPCDANNEADILKNIEWVESQFSKRNFSTRRLKTSTLPVLLLEKKARVESAKTILFYYHSDGQPVKPAEWQQDDPFQPVLKKKEYNGSGWETLPFSQLEGLIDPEWRIFGRASSDDKGPGVMLLAALDALQSIGVSPNYHLKILVDFEEEKGSASLPSVIVNEKKALASDLLLIFDGPAHASNLPTLTFGARGITTITLTTYGPFLPQHSGHLGNYAPNPAFRLAKILADMKSEDGEVLIPGFYDGVKITAKQKLDFSNIPDNLPALNNQLGIKTSEKVGNSLQEALMYPSLNVRGLKSGEVGPLAATIIPHRAVAEIDIRTVASTDPEKLVTHVKQFIEKKGYYLVNQDPTMAERAQYDKICKFTSKVAYGAFGTEINGPMGTWLSKAVEKTTGKEIVKLPTMGGSVPISPFVNLLGVQAVIVPTVNPDNNQHSANENLRLGNYFEGIKTMMGILSSDF
jgi:acetylornithine deacetylase/succinyl-diaminopimelate desuccinylase-like protein